MHSSGGTTPQNQPHTTQLNIPIVMAKPKAKAAPALKTKHQANNNKPSGVFMVNTMFRLPC